MKLSAIVEAGISRRDFLRASGKIMSALLAAGVDPSIAKKIMDAEQKGKPMWLHISADFASDPRSKTFNQEWLNSQKIFNFTHKILPNAAKKLAAANEELSLWVSITPKELPRLFSLFGHPEIEEDILAFYGSELGDKLPGFAGGGMGAHIEFGNIEGIDVTHDNLFKGWWKEWGNWGEGYMDKKTAKRLERMGIDPKRAAINGPGLNSDYVRAHHTGSDQLEDWEREYEPEETKKPEDLRDYQLASPMHQPFESKLAKALKLLQ